VALTASWLSYSVEGERATRSCNRLRVLIKQLRTQARAVRSSSRRNGHLSDINEVALIRAWSILESYLNGRGDALLQRDLPVPSPPLPLPEHIRGAVLDQWTRWPELQKFWEIGLGLGGPLWKQLLEYKELRNLIAHGHGYVRPRPGRPYTKALMARLAFATSSPATYAGRIPLADKDVDRFLALVQRFVDWAEKARP
jgi:hypothetical protein